MHTIALLCGGTTRERGISLNSARSFLDHTAPFLIELSLFYLNPHNQFYQLTAGQLYSNTPADFDFKLAQEARPLDEEKLLFALRAVDLVFPLIHGAYGENGELQQWFERHAIPFAGCSSRACHTIFNKYRAKQFFSSHGFNTLPFQHIASPDADIEPFWKAHRLERAVIKPTESGSSIGVLVVDSVTSAREAIRSEWEMGFRELILEPYCEEAEFTICVLENRKGAPTSLLPIDIDKGKGTVLDYRKKYLPSEETRYYCPPRYPATVRETIRREAARLFQCAYLSDFARIDGWVAPDGTVRFSDVNPISGMEQNSFLFQQAARIGMTHAELLAYVIDGALQRAQKPPLAHRETRKAAKQPVYVLMGGNTSERQVSLLSGTNVWLKLLDSERFAPAPFLWDPPRSVWQLPYPTALHHTVEEMSEECHTAPQMVPRAAPWVAAIRRDLGLLPAPSSLPQRKSLAAWLREAKQTGAFVFLALHGGKGEDGTIQEKLQKYGIPFNGSGKTSSRLCMDKFRTARTIAALQNPEILPMQQVSFRLSALVHGGEEALWMRAIEKLGTSELLIKPQADGCSTGVARLTSWQDLALYLHCLRSGAGQIPPRTLREQPSIISMPLFTGAAGFKFLLEPFISTDTIAVEGTTLRCDPATGWCEMTLGILEKGGVYTPLNPSLTIAENHILSLEEKFQGGTGINITPPPPSILSPSALRRVQSSACMAAKALGIQGYARLDLFVHTSSGTIRVIEANTLPALTPSTVLYHQALSLTPPIPPRQLIEMLIENGIGSEVVLLSR